MKVLVAYYSNSDENWHGSKITELKSGNTKDLADIIIENFNADSFEIIPSNPYPKKYSQIIEVAKLEKTNNTRPEYIKSKSDLSEYDVIFIGYPIWWQTAPMIVLSFLLDHNFKNKIIIPFCTHEGSGMGDSEEDIRKACPLSDIRPGLSESGSKVIDDKSEIIKKLNEYKIH